MTATVWIFGATLTLELVSTFILIDALRRIYNVLKGQSSLVVDWVTIIVHVASFVLFIFSQVVYMVFQVDSIKRSSTTSKVVLWPNLIRQFVGSSS